MTFEHSPVALSGVRMTQRNGHKRVSLRPIKRLAGRADSTWISAFAVNGPSIFSQKVPDELLQMDESSKLAEALFFLLNKLKINQPREAS